jgi:hypothetical protein
MQLFDSGIHYPPSFHSAETFWMKMPPRTDLSQLCDH